MDLCRSLGPATSRVLSAGVLLASLWGCAALPPNSLFDPTKVGQFGFDSKEMGIRRILTPRDTPPGIAHATEPTPDDLVPILAEYRLQPGDTLAVNISGLLAPGVPWSAALAINPMGEIRIPELGTVKVAGLTEQEVEQELSARLVEAELLPDPLVTVFSQVQRGRQYSIIGAVRAPGPYPIPHSDFRLMEAIAMAGDVDASARKLYIIRQESTPPPRMAEDVVVEEPRPDDGLIIPPPVEGEPGAPVSYSSSLGLALVSDDLPEEADDSEQDVTREDLEAVMSPPKAETQPTTRESTPGEGRRFEQLVFEPTTGQWVEMSPDEPAPEPETDVVAVDEDLEAPFDWEAVEEVGLEQRVIEIDIPELKRGNPRYNVVLRGRDVVNIPVDTGVYYMMGEINRPGVYGFGGRQISLKQAIASAGGFAALAWPQRCEVIRREPGTDNQLTIPVNVDAIFAGLEQDFYLRNDDIVNVGTHVVAPFLFVMRNSFRFTYGFGFVYDRNFADKDAYTARPNPAFLADNNGLLF